MSERRDERENDRPASGRPDAGKPTPSITHAMEDYLKGIYRLQEAGPAVTTQALADELGISGPSATNMVKRLHELRLVEHAPYHGVRLTPAGERVALEVVRHHRLLELYLAESLGYAWDEVHAEAERLEHLMSDELEARMDRALGYPTRDPHGDPIPTPSGEIATVPSQPLPELAVGATATVVRVSDRSPERLRYLGDLGLRPGAAVTMLEKHPFDGPLRLMVDGGEHYVGPTAAAAVWVDRSAIDDGRG
ncbi:MAG TPA: metal-dependent transcriptional regulator [Thermomicrobiales bacterium]|nr:metal-dependent transcriptional regulator [Thermomicrobiales bacterium]